MNRDVDDSAVRRVLQVESLDVARLADLVALRVAELLRVESASEQVLSVSQVAVMRRVSERTVRRWIASGALDVERVGRTVRVSQSALDRFVEPGRSRRKVEPAGAYVNPMRRDRG